MLSKKQQRAIRYLVLGWRAKKIAKKLGVTTFAVYKWLGDPVFKAEWERLDQSFLDALDANIKKVREKAVNVLIKMMDSSNAADRRFAVHEVLNISRSVAKPTVVKHEHTGSIVQDHTGEIGVKKLNKKARRSLQEFLEATRDLQTEN